jgi:hypothetical protein
MKLTDNTSRTPTADVSNGRPQTKDVSNAIAHGSCQADYSSESFDGQQHGLPGKMRGSAKFQLALGVTVSDAQTSTRNITLSKPALT